MLGGRVTPDATDHCCRSVALRVLGVVLDARPGRSILMLVVPVSAMIGSKMRIKIQMRSGKCTLFKVFLLNDSHRSLHPLANLLRLFKFLVVLSVDTCRSGEGAS